MADQVTGHPTIETPKRPEDLLYWRGKDVKTMSRDELEAALREACVLYSNLLDEQSRRGKFTAEMMRLAARR